MKETLIPLAEAETSSLRDKMNSNDTQGISRMFDGIACNYDLLNSLFSFGMNHYWKRVLIRDQNGASPELALDICTGTAETGISFSRCYRSCRVVGLDASASMLKRGKAKIERKGLSGQFSLIKADGLHMPFADSSFDVILNSFGLRNEHDHRKALSEMARVLRPKGRINILEFSLPTNRLFRHIYLFYLSRIMPLISRLFYKDGHAYNYLSETIQKFPSREEIVKIMSDCGFKEIELKPLTGGIVCIYKGRLAS